MSTESWPPQLKEWVAKCLGQITESNRVEVQSELKQVIGEAFAAQTLWTTDWAGVQLKSLLPKPPPLFNVLKRKSFEPVVPTNGKKAKKAALKTTLDYGDKHALAMRAQRFQREHAIERTKAARIGGQDSPQTYSPHSHLFNRSTSTSSPYAGIDEPEGDPNVIDWDKFTIVGTSKEIFKDYLRLTSEPKPETIRPYNVLQTTLTELKKRWKDKAKSTSYSWICNQFKSLRQDLTVQRIKNEFTVQVYEIHARIALESNDLVEYNQCQATLKVLYDLGIPGKVEEFTAYRILMLLHGRNRSELNLYVSQLTPRQKSSPPVKHALEVQKAQAMGNYYSLCRLYIDAPNMGAYIMDHFIDRERAKGMLTITKSYRTATLEFVRHMLGFDDLSDAHNFLSDHSIALFTNPNSPDAEKILDCRNAHTKLTQVYEDKYRKVMIRGAI